MTKKYNWTTLRGAKIELIVTIEVTTQKGYYDTFSYSVASLSVNGKSYSNVKFIDLAYNIQLGMQGNQPILLAVPQEFVRDFHREESEIAEIKTNNVDTYAINHMAVVKAMAK